jgi:hypothetical protein
MTCDSRIRGVNPFSISPCSRCIDLPLTLPNWKGITLNHPYDEAFRVEMRPRYLPPSLNAIASTAMVNTAAAKVTSNGATASYYQLPAGATELQDLISAKDMNAQMGEIFRAVYRFGEVAHSPKLRDIKKIIFYANEELKRLEKLGTK